MTGDTVASLEQMHERDEILVMLLVAGFFGSSFWPVFCGWVDLMTLDGWLSLCASYGTMVVSCAVLGLVISIGTALIALPGFLFRCVKDRRSSERQAFLYMAGLPKIVLHHIVRQIWRTTWWLAMFIKRQLNTVG